MMTRRNLLKKINEWEEKFQNCQFIGDIYLQESELTSLSRSLLKARKDGAINRGQYASALTVLGVNCAYHYYDDQGFWVHFTNLFGIKNTSAQTDLIGSMIEKKLENIGMLRVKRTGPFRFVGTILEQCGVSRRYIPSFAKIIRELKKDRDWDVLLDIDHREFQHEISVMGCSRYLKNYLLDVEGWRFTGHACHLLSCHEQGMMTIEDLKSIPGFQPDFWDEFMMCFYNRERSEGEKVRLKTSISPWLQFLPDRKCLGLVFPSPKYVDGLIYPEANTSWTFPLTIIKNEDLLVERYYGKLRTSTNDAYWESHGWLPDGEPVIFDLRQGLLARGTTLSPGAYYLLSPKGYDILTEDITIKYGTVNLPGYWEYNAYQVQLISSDVIPGYEIEEFGAIYDLRWAEVDNLLVYASSGIEVFTGNLPEIIVNDMSAIHDNNIGMFYQTDFASGRVTSEADLRRFRDQCISSAPVSGCIWLTRLGRDSRMNSLRAAPKLDFILMPEFSFNFEERLYGFNEKVNISIAGSGYKFFLDQFQAGENHWVIPAKHDMAQGILKYGEFSMDINIIIRRARLFNKEGSPIRYLSKKDLKDCGDFLVSGYPGTSGVVLIEKSNGPEIPVKFDLNGNAVIKANRLYDALKESKVKISEIHVRCEDNTIVSTGAIIFNLESIKSQVYSEHPCSISVPSTRNFNLVIGLARTLCEGKDKEIFIKRLPESHKEISRWLKGLIACSSVLDSSRIEVGGDRIEGFEFAEDPELKNLLKILNPESVILGVDREITEENLNALPKVDRWQQFFRDLKSNRNHVFRSIFLEWADEVVNFRVPFRSRIALQKGGNALSLVWNRYLNGTKASNVLEVLCNVEGPELVSSLRNVLSFILLLREGRFQTANDFLLQKPHESLIALNTRLDVILSLLNGGIPRGVKIQPDQPDTYTALPLRTEDRILFQVAGVACDQSNKVIKIHRETGDWLLLVLLVRLAISDKDRIYLLSRLTKMRHNLPSSPEWNIGDEVKYDKGGNKVGK